MANIIAGTPAGEFLDAAEMVLDIFFGLTENPQPEKKGAYIAVLKKSEPGLSEKMLLVAELGTCESKPHKAGKYFDFCQEKTRRLEICATSVDHISSWQSRNVDKNQYGGAITASKFSNATEEGKKLVGALSGLTEHGDEAVTLVIWLIFKWITLDDAKAIVAISDNPLFYPLYRACEHLMED